jgi:hypothetical protein
MDEAENGRMVIRIERRGVRRYTCSGCGRRTQRRLVCRSCGIRTERIEFADPKARVSRRLQQQIGVDCQSMPTSHVSRACSAALEAWAMQRCCS